MGFGVDIVIGTGIFTLTGVEAKHHAGPAVIISFVIAGPILPAVLCLYLATNLSVATWLRFVVWLVLGLAIYIGYGRRHARVGSGEVIRDRGVPEPDPIR